MDKVKRARQELNLLRGYIRRTGITGWTDRSARGNYQTALRAVVAVEDERGIEDPTTIALSDRLDDLRREAMAAGLLTPRELRDAETAVFT